MTYKVKLYQNKKSNFMFTEFIARLQVRFNHFEEFDELNDTPMWDAIEDNYLAEEYTEVEREVRYVKIECDAGYVGTNDEECVMLPAEWTDEQISEYANEFAYGNAECYSYHIEQEYEDEDEDTLNSALEDYYAEYGSGAWHEVTLEEWEEECGIMYVG